MPSRLLAEWRRVRRRQERGECRARRAQRWRPPGAFYDGGAPEPYLLWQVIAHVPYHRMQHRGEAVMLLTHFGHSPVGIDMVFWLDERA